MARIKGSMQDRVFEACSYFILTIVLITILYPLHFVAIASFSDPVQVNLGNVVFIPKGITFDGYARVFNFDQLWIGFRNSVIYTILGTLINITVTLMVAYPLSRKVFSGKKAITFYLIFTMYFNGGLIPTFLVVKSLGLYNNWLVMIIMGAVSVFNVIIARTFIQNSIPEELFEAAFIDGSSHLNNFIKIVIPLSRPIIAVLTLYYGVAHWNNFMDALVYLSDKNLYNLQLVLRGILTSNQVSADLMTDFEDFYRRQNEVELMKYGMIVISSVPLLFIYPFLQKYFTKGIMIGSLKG